MIKKSASFVLRNVPYFIFAAFVALEAWIMRFVVLFGDDYYYTTFFNYGIGYFFRENVFHYMKTNGRAWVHLLDELLLCNGTIWAWRIFNTAVIALIIWFSALIIGGTREKRGKSFKTALVLLCALFSVINIKMAYQCVYWATGAMNYLLPVLLVLMYFRLMQRYLSGEKLGAAAIFLAFFACSSTEQCAFAALCVSALTFLAVLLKKEKPCRNLIFASVASIIGFAVLFLAPGNSVRTTYYSDFYSMGLLQRILYNLPRIFNLIFSDWGMADIIIVFLVASLFRRILKPRGVLDYISALVSLSGAASLYVYIHGGGGKAFFIVSIVCTLLIFIENIVRYLIVYIKSKDMMGLFFTVMPPLLQCAILVSPEFGPRTALASAVMLFIPTVKFILESEIPAFALGTFAAALVLISAPGRLVTAAVIILAVLCLVFALLKKPEIAVISILLICSAIMADRQYELVRGYSANYTVHLRNYENIENYKSETDSTEPLVIFILPDESCKYTMPYDNPYHEYWFKKAYGLTEETEIRYEPYTEAVNE